MYYVPTHTQAAALAQLTAASAALAAAQQAHGAAWLAAQASGAPLTAVAQASGGRSAGQRQAAQQRKAAALQAVSAAAQVWAQHSGPGTANNGPALHSYAYALRTARMVGAKYNALRRATVTGLGSSNVAYCGGPLPTPLCAALSAACC